MLPSATNTHFFAKKLPLDFRMSAFFIILHLYLNTKKMKKQIGNYEFELANDMILLREADTKRLLRAKTIKPFEAVDKFNAVCKHWETKLEQTAIAV